MKKLLLTGSAGFIGKNLKVFLEERYDILCPRSFELDLTDEGAVQSYFTEHQVDAIIHCGSTGGTRGQADKSTTVEDNLAMVDNLLAAKRADVRVVLFGSGAMYAKSRNIHKVHENTLGDFTPLDLYGQSKLQIAERIAGRDDVVCLNIFGCYGYGELCSRFPTYAILQNLTKNPIIINQNVVFDYLFVEDMQRIVTYFLENITQDNIINATPTNSISLLDIAQIVNSLSPYKSEIIIKNPMLNNEYTGSNQRLLENYKDCTFTSYEEGLTKLMQYLQKTMKLEAQL